MIIVYKTKINYAMLLSVGYLFIFILSLPKKCNSNNESSEFGWIKVNLAYLIQQMNDISWTLKHSTSRIWRINFVFEKSVVCYK